MATRTRTLALVVLVLLSISAPAEPKPRRRRTSPAGLSTTFYQKSCPRFEQIMRDVITPKQISSPTTAAPALRLLFHDCLLNGCDASVLLSSTPLSPAAERDADINLSLPGDAFDAVVRAKTALELACPAVVSCADVLAFAVRDLVAMLGGPHYSVALGRRDSRTSLASSVPGNLPTPSMPMAQILRIFAARGLSAGEAVALSGAHTVGFSHCREFSAGIYNFSRTSASDPRYNPRFAEGLRRACAGFGSNPTLSVFNDVMTPNKFDNAYFQNLRRGLGLLRSDQGLYEDPSTRPFVELYAADEGRFFEDFARAMEKLTVYGVKTGRDGEIRRRCDQVN